jgi:hypothetical protein
MSVALDEDLQLVGVVRVDPAAMGEEPVAGSPVMSGLSDQSLTQSSKILGISSEYGYLT